MIGGRSRAGPEAGYVGIGSNIEPRENVRRAVRLLASRVRVTGLSTFYLTEPVGAAGEPRFVNGVAAIETALSLEGMRALLSEIEDELGRRRSEDPNAARRIDLDLLLLGSRVAPGEGSRSPLPHPDIETRPYVALPLLELAPELVLPGSGRLLADVAAGFPGPGGTPLAGFTRDLRRLVGVDARG
ncbi:MAG: 2-amino-4-hydroxy-6-hydroxymethyldihydropteridine diphosphokinase [Gemmatimonadota bacterium]